MTGIWYDHRLVDQLRDEAPSAYKDIRAIARAQRELLKIARVLRPLLNTKAFELLLAHPQLPLGLAYKARCE